MSKAKKIKTRKAAAKPKAHKPTAKAKSKKVVAKKTVAKKTVAKKTVAKKPPRRSAAKPLTLPMIGAPFQSGFYAGKFFGADGKPYALIVAPKATGETEAKFKTERTADAGARSLRDGLANSEAMNDAAHPAAQFCRGLTIGGHKDWYLPSRHEAALMAETLMPGADYVPEQTVAPAFKEGGPEAFDRRWYWTSTEFDRGFAWCQNFYFGLQYGYDKVWSCRVRAVRKYPL